MNSYPAELLAQLAPVMFVAGLDPSQSTADALSPPQQMQDAFQVLTHRLRDVLLAQRRVSIWQPEKTNTFQVVLMDKEIRFPPRKLVAPDDPQYSSSHSPLSPLTPTSPLSPDGLIAPIWIRKHTTLVPAVFVIFLRIFERSVQAARLPPDLPDGDADREREAEERKKDSELAAEIAHRKKLTNERGVKLTAVLMATRRMLDDPGLDVRLTFIRRQSGLDSRASLFVLSPVSASELNEFVKSLQQALHEPALEYYTAHSKRVRRKRNRHSQSTTYPAGAGGLNVARPLRPEGWTVRYEYKMACFAEFRGEDEVALKHYQDAYEMLIVMFGSTAILPPRTKRWAEAKVLVDCINIKIVKLYLYNNEHSLALSHHNTHIRQFGDFFRGCGIGEETFEFWSWVARQYRVLAELLELGLRSDLVLPDHKPLSSNTGATAPQTSRNAGLEYESARSLGINPSHALHHPGFYYYVAARCTELRRNRFLAALEAERNQQPMALSPGFANEKKVEHLAIVNELYTKAYELFKKFSAPSNQGQGRLTLWIAHQIAQTYYLAGKYDMAVRFFERIAKTYRRERWDALLRPLLSTWYACAKQLEEVELSIKLLIEMLGDDTANKHDTGFLKDDLIAVFTNTVPASPDQVLTIALDDTLPMFRSNVIFWSPEVKVGELAAFQLSMTAPISTSISSIPFTRLQIFFARDAFQPVTIHHRPSSENDASSRWVNLGSVSRLDSATTLSANLNWTSGATVVFGGSVSSDTPGKMEISSIVLSIEKNGWKVEIQCESRSSHPETPTRWLSSLRPIKFIAVNREDCHLTVVKHREHLINVAFNHNAPAYLDEDYPVEIEITNVDTRELEVVLNLLLQPTETDDAVNWIVVDGEKSSSLVKGIQLGVVGPGITTTKTVHLFNTGAGGDRTIDVSIQTKTVSSGSQDNCEIGAGDDLMEHLKLLVVPTVIPIEVAHGIVYRRRLDPWAGLADLTTFEDSYWDNRGGSEATVTLSMTCVGRWGLLIENIELEKKDNPFAVVVDSSTDVKDVKDDLLSSEFIQGDKFCISCRINICFDDKGNNNNQLEGPGRFCITWHRILPNSRRGPTATTYFGLPVLQSAGNELEALLDVPTKATLHKSFTMTLTIRNHHPSRSANITVHLDPESLEGFVVSGIRNGRVPVLLPESEETLVWLMIPLECGYVKLPQIKVVDARTTTPAAGRNADELSGTGESSGDIVKVIDRRHDFRRPIMADSDSAPESGVTLEDGPLTILVLP